MSEATAAQPDPELPRTREGQIALLGDLFAENRRIFAEAARIASAPMTAGDRTEVLMLARRAADIEGVELAILGKLREEVQLRSVQEIWEKAVKPDLAPVPAPEPHPRRARHRKNNPDQAALPFPHLRGLPSWVPVPLAAAWEVARHPAQHAVAAGTAATLAVGVPLATVTVLSGPHAHAATAVTTQSAPPGWSATGVPITAPSSGRIASAVTHPKADAATSSPIAWIPAPPPPVRGSGDPQGQPSSQVQVQVPQVKLVVTTSLDLGAGSSGTIRLTAFGGTVNWSASSSVAGLDLGASSGTLAPGDTATITVSVLADLQALAGSGTVTIRYGDGKTASVPVSWLALPVPVPTDVLPSALPTVTLPGI